MGATRVKAFVDSVPLGRLVFLDMDVSGLWHYYSDYAYFGAPFIWTTLHNMGGNDGLKGDMRLLNHMPAYAFAAVSHPVHFIGHSSRFSSPMLRSIVRI